MSSIERPLCQDSLTSHIQSWIDEVLHINYGGKEEEDEEEEEEGEEEEGIKQKSKENEDVVLIKDETQQAKNQEDSRAGDGSATKDGVKEISSQEELEESDDVRRDGNIDIAVEKPELNEKLGTQLNIQVANKDHHFSEGGKSSKEERKDSQYIVKGDASNTQTTENSSGGLLCSFYANRMI